MIRPLAIVALTIAILATAAAAATARQDHGSHGHGHGQRGDRPATPVADQPYADRFDPTAGIRTLTAEQIAQIERGEGAGFALPAELNGVPGPRHVLDFAAELGLTPEQQAAVEAIAAEMRADVLAAGPAYLEAVLALEIGFREGILTAEALPARVAEVKRREGELATAHLAAHLETAAVLTAEQIAEYNRLRGYGGETNRGG